MVYPSQNEHPDAQTYYRYRYAKKYDHQRRPYGFSAMGAYHNVRMQWLEICAKDIFSQYAVLPKDMVYNKNQLLQSLDDSFRGIQQLLDKSWEIGGKVKGFKKGIIPLLGYFISHESHHRGNIMLTLKLSGEKLPDELKWGLWEWS